MHAMLQLLIEAEVIFNDAWRTVKHAGRHGLLPTTPIKLFRLYFIHYYHITIVLPAIDSSGRLVGTVCTSILDSSPELLASARKKSPVIP